MLKHTDSEKLTDFDSKGEYVVNTINSETVAHHQTDKLNCQLVDKLSLVRLKRIS